MTPNKKPKYEREYQIYLAHHAQSLSKRPDVIKAPLASTTLEIFAVAQAYYDTNATDYVDADGEHPGAICLRKYSSFVDALVDAGLITLADSDE